MRRFLTFDLGTTLFKVALFDDSGNMLDIERIAPPIERPQPGWIQLDPERFIDAIVEAARALKARTGDWQDIAAVSFASQANSFSFLDDSGDTTIKFILWPDQRAAPLAQELARFVELPGFRQASGMPRFGPTLALAKILWLRRHAPSAFDGAKDFCLISDYLTSLLSDQDVTEAGVAALTGALDARSLRWRDDVLQRVGLPPIRMLPVRRAGTNLGPINRAWGRTFGLGETCCFVLGCLDQYAGAIGTGTVSPGQICETTGTVLAAVRCDDHLDPDPAPDVFQGPGFAPERFFQMSFSSTSANLLEHYRNSLPDKPSFEDLTRQASAADDDVIIEPSVEGRSIEACFAQVQDHHTRGQVVRGIMRCVAQALKQQVESLSPGQLPREIRAAGGGAKSDRWLQLKADLLQVSFVSLECEEPTSLGAAILAAHGIGMGSVDELAHQWVRPRAVFTPQR